MARTEQTSKLSAHRSHSTFFSGSKGVVVPRVLLVLSVFALVALGIVMVFSSSTVEAINEGAPAQSYVVKQFVYAGIGLVLCVGIIVVYPYRHWFSSELVNGLSIFWLISVVLLLLTALMGSAALGAKRWLVLGPISFQPSEFAKAAFVLICAKTIFQWKNDEIDFSMFLLRMSIMVGAPLLLLFFTQSDLGTTLICGVGLFVVAFIGGMSRKTIFVIMAGALIFVLIATFGVGYRSNRMSFLNPYADPQGSGYQLIHSFYAFGEGGLTGVGLGNSVEKYLYLPEAETDFIFAIIGEELGLIGAGAVIVLFVVVLWAGMKISRNAPDLMGSMIAGGCTAMIVFQAFLNIACVIGMAPTTGKPLPFISAGGSSLIGSLVLIGAILAVSLGSDEASPVHAQRRDNLEVLHARRSERRVQTTSNAALRASRLRDAVLSEGPSYEVNERRTRVSDRAARTSQQSSRSTRRTSKRSEETAGTSRTSSSASRITTSGRSQGARSERLSLAQRDHSSSTGRALASTRSGARSDRASGSMTSARQSRRRTPSREGASSRELRTDRRRSR